MTLLMHEFWNSQIHGESRMNGGCHEMGGGRVGSYCLMGQVSVWEDERGTEMEGGDGCTTM